MRPVRAEFLKLRKRRGLVAATAFLTIVPVIAALTVVSILHAVDPAKYDTAGGIDGLNGSLRLLTQIGVVAAVLVGATAGAGDQSAGVFRELVVTGRSRLQLFAARVPGGLALLLPFVAGSILVASVASVAFLGDGQTAVTAGAVAEFAGWVVLTITVSYLLALGVSSAFGSRGTAIGVLLGWQLAVMPILLASGRLDNVLPNAALLALSPAEDAQVVTTSTTAAVAILAAWTLVPLGVGAWRTRTMDA